VEAAPARWWDRAIKLLVPAALIAAMLAYAFPFFKPLPIPIDHIFRVDTGLTAFHIGFIALTMAPLNPLFEQFSLPLIAAFVGLMYLRRPGWTGSVVPLACAVFGFAALGSAYVWPSELPFAYGYYLALGCFLTAAAAAAVRLVLLRRGGAAPEVAVTEPDEPAASASQQLLARYRYKA
jgi:hypothetical protein